MDAAAAQAVGYDTHECRRVSITTVVAAATTAAAVSMGGLPRSVMPAAAVSNLARPGPME